MKPCEASHHAVYHCNSRYLSIEPVTLCSPVQLCKGEGWFADGIVRKSWSGGWPLLSSIERLRVEVGTIVDVRARDSRRRLVIVVDTEY